MEETFPYLQQLKLEGLCGICFQYKQNSPALKPENFQRPTGISFVSDDFGKIFLFFLQIYKYTIPKIIHFNNKSNQQPENIHCTNEIFLQKRRTLHNKIFIVVQPSLEITNKKYHRKYHDYSLSAQSNSRFPSFSKKPML